MEVIERISAMRQSGDLQGARRLGEEAVACGNDSSAIVNTLIDTYLDIAQECHRTGVTSYLDEINRRIDELLAEYGTSDRLSQRRRAIRMSTLPGYDELHRLDELSHHDGHEAEAYTLARKYMTDNPVNPLLHEVTAFILYRYLRACYSSLESTVARRLLADYLALTVPKPSRVHSLMLRMAVRVARRFPDFNFARFFRLWNPRTLRRDDILPEGNDGRPLPSLAMAALSCVIDSPQSNDFAELLDLIPATPEEKTALLRDTFHHLTRKAIEADDNKGAIELLDLYSRYCTLHTACDRHSAMLGMALRVIRDAEAWRFPEFFVSWDPAYFRQDDFRPVVNRHGESVIPLATRAMGRCFAVIKNDLPRHSYLLPSVIRAFDSVAAIMPGGPDEQLERRRAMMLAWADCEDTAVDRFCALASRPEIRSANFWQDFSDIIRQRQLKMGIIALGLLKTDPGDPDIGSLRLSMAQLLHFQGEDSSASLELKLYADEIASMAAEPSARYGAIAATIDVTAIPAPSNELLYHTLAAEALDLIYNRFSPRQMCVVKTDGPRLLLSDGATRPIEIDTRVWPIAERMHVGDNMSVRTDNTGRIVAIRPTDGRPYSALPLHYGIVVGLNPLSVHCAGKSDSIETAYNQSISIGTPVSLRVWRDASCIRRGIELSPVSIADARRHFDHICVTIYSRDTDGTAHYSAGPEIEPGTIPATLAENIPDNTPVDLYFYRTSDGQRHAISLSQPLTPDRCPALKSVSGPLKPTTDGGWAVRDVMLPKHLIEAQNIEADTYLKVTAIYIPRRQGQSPYWQALTAESY